ncbi:hypothetical protein [Moheibacter stercoris]|uniref:Uncharacterized protein n=1 Tax=Moheibacter stercoris TaxID=1628251 RepID=A0ABV2LTD1_9FLAO
MKPTKNEIIFIYNSVDYFQKLIKDKGYPIFELYPNENFKTRVLKKLFKKLSINDSILFGNWTKHLKKAKTVVVFATVNLYVLEFIKKQNPSIQIIYWYWNPAYRIGRPTEALRQLADIWTFDEIDKENYQLKYNNTFYFDEINSSNSPKEFDIVFVGRNKHRKEKLLELETYFTEHNYRNFFHIVPNRNEGNPEKIKELSYKEYLNLINQSKAILDISPPSQVGLTLRPMESLFLEIKLITDNIHIKKEPFYHPLNIFILGEDNLDGLRHFLDSPYQPISQEIKTKYDFDTWLDRMLDQKEFTY